MFKRTCTFQNDLFYVTDLPSNLSKWRRLLISLHDVLPSWNSPKNRPRSDRRSQRLLYPNGRETTPILKLLMVEKTLSTEICVDYFPMDLWVWGWVPGLNGFFYSARRTGGSLVCMLFRCSRRLRTDPTAVKKPTDLQIA